MWGAADTLASQVIGRRLVVMCYSAWRFLGRNAPGAQGKRRDCLEAEEERKMENRECKSKSEVIKEMVF